MLPDYRINVARKKESALLLFSFLSLKVRVAMRQGYFAERRTQDVIVLNMQMRRDNNLALFSNPLKTMPFCILQI